MKSIKYMYDLIKQKRTYGLTLNSDNYKFERKKVISEIKFYQTVLNYMLTEPSEDFLRKEYDRLSVRLVKIYEGLFIYSDTERKKYELLFDVKHIKEQINVLKFILD